MKLLMIYCNQFGWKPTLKTMDDAPEGVPGSVQDAVVGMIHVEPDDIERQGKVITKLVKHLKWLAGKNETKTILLHSFSHLSEAKAPASSGQELFDRAQERLEGAGYEVTQTPFGYFNDLRVDAPGHPLARVFKSI